MLTTLDSYVNFQNKIDHFTELIDDCIPEIFEMDRDIEKILKVARKHKVPGIGPTERSIHALLLSVIANVKANRAHYIALKARIDALDELINLSYYS